MSVAEQGRNLCLFFIIGLFIGCIFDMFRGFRRSIRLPNLIVDLQDILFLIISGFIYFRSILLFNHGELRLYILLSSAIGIIIYALTLSQSCSIIFEEVFKLLKLTVRMIWRLLKLPYYFARKKPFKKSKIKE